MSLAAYDTDSVIRLTVLVVLLSALLAAGVKFFSTPADSSKRQTPPIVDLLTRYTPVQDAVLAQLDIADIISLSKTTKAFRGCVKLVERTQFNIDERLKHFFSSPGRFRALQAQHNIIIAGTFAYDFMARKPFDRTAGKRQLDGLLVQAGPNAYALHFFLVNDGFKSLDEPIPGISVGQCQHRTMRRTASNGDVCDINITETQNTPVYGILHYPTTFLLTFITWNRAYSILPYETFVSKRTYLLQRIDAFDTICWQAAQDAGLEVFHMELDDAVNTNALSKKRVLGARRIGDARTWMVRLETSSTANSSPYPNYLVDFATFEIAVGYRRALQDRFGHYCVYTRVIRRLSLRHQYVAHEIPDTLENWLGDVAVMSLYRLPLAERPQELLHLFDGSSIDRRVMASINKGFTPPPGSKWKYCDGEILKFLEEEYPELKQEL